MALSDNVRGAALMAAAMACFVTNDTLMKLTSEHLSLYQAVFLRGIVASVLMAFIAWRQGALLVVVPRRDRPILLGRFVGEAGSTVAFLTALYHLPLANLTAIMQALPLAVTLGAAVFLREPVGWRRYTAIAVGFLGVLVIVRPGAEGFSLYSIWALVAVAFVVLRDLTTRRLSREVPSIFVAMTTAVGITVLGAIMLPTVEWRPVATSDIVRLCFAAVFVVGGYSFSVMTMRVGDISFSAPFRYSVLIWAILLGIFVFDHIPSRWTLIGAAIVVGTGIYTFYRERVRQRKAAGRVIAASSLPPAGR